MKHEFSDRLRFCRRQRGLTQEQLAEAMGVSVAAVSKWELGQSVPELETLLELADFFDLSVDALLGFRLRDGGCQEAGARIDAARREKRCRSTPTASPWSTRRPSSSTWRASSASGSPPSAGPWTS